MSEYSYLYDSSHNIRRFRCYIKKQTQQKSPTKARIYYI